MGRQIIMKKNYILIGSIAVAIILLFSLEMLEQKEEIGNDKEVIQKILEENRDAIDVFFETYPEALRWVQFSRFDFRKDGQMEFILSEEHVERNSVIISHNYVYDCKGNKLLEFVSGEVSEIGIFYDEDGRLFYLESNLHVGAHHDIMLYEEITAVEDMEITLAFVEWDMRDGKERNKNQGEGYVVFGNFTKDEERTVWEQDIEEILEMLNKKEAEENDEEIKQYILNLEELEKSEVELWGSMYDLEKGIEFIE